jgi:hypothetical protein
MHTNSDQLDLRFGLSFDDLYRQEGLARLDQAFLEQLQSANPPLAQRLLDARANPSSLPRKQQSDLIVELAPHVEDFIGELFGISADLRALQAKHHSLAPIYALKRRSAALPRSRPARSTAWPWPRNWKPSLTNL